jgi:hypothetical protein
MGDFLQQIFLSDVVIFLVMGFALMLVTGWMIVLREFAGYLLGWLVGIFLIIVLSTLLPGGTQSPADDFVVNVTFLMLMLPSMVGLAAGFGVMWLIRMGIESNSWVGRALTIAAITSAILVTWYLMLLTVYQTRLMIGIFALTFAIGALFSFILMRGAMMTISRQPVQRKLPINQSADGFEPINTLEPGQPITPVEPPSHSVQDRVHSLRERLRRRPPQV